MGYDNNHNMMLTAMIMVVTKIDKVMTGNDRDNDDHILAMVTMMAMVIIMIMLMVIMMIAVVIAMIIVVEIMIII